jgi:hypothetical protein
MLIGNVVAILFLAAMILKWIKVKKYYKFFFTAIFLLIFAFTLFKNVDRNAILSLINPKKIIAIYQEYNKVVADKEGSYSEVNLKTKLYNPIPEVKVVPKAQTAQITPEPEVKVVPKAQTAQITPEPEVKVVPKAQTAQITPEPEVKVVPKAQTAQITPEPQIRVESYALTPPESAMKPQINPVNLLSSKQEYRDLGVAYNNVIFRIFIWRDVCKQLISNIPIFGFAFGKPFRSKSLEILGWAETEWKKVGWISMHNSYLDIIYRGGIIGLGVIITLLAILCIMFKKVLSINSFSGILLLSVLISWLIASSFLETLELPCTAIVFWSLFGLLYAYLFKPIESDVLT